MEDMSSSDFHLGWLWHKKELKEHFCFVPKLKPVPEADKFLQVIRISKLLVQHYVHHLVRHPSKLVILEMQRQSAQGNKPEVHEPVQPVLNFLCHVDLTESF